MSLQDRTQVYIRTWIRSATVEEVPGGWHASLPRFGLSATGGSRDDAEDNLLILLTAYVLAAPLSGSPLPPIEDIDLTTRTEAFADDGSGPMESASIEPDQAWYWSSSWQAGEREASEDIAAGRVESFDTAEEFLASFSD